MKYLFTLLVCSSVFFASCKSSSTAPPDTSKGTPTAVGTPVGSPVSATIDATGGTITSPDGRLELIIPPNALTSSKAISIQPITNQTPLGAGLGFELLPNGQTFNVPITLRFHYDSTDLLGGDVRMMALATQKDDRIWYRLGATTLDEAARTLSVTSTHFSSYNMYHSLRLIPYFEDVPVKKTTLVAVVFVNEGEADATGYPLSNYVFYSVPSQISWSVNGTPMGSPQNGTLTATPNVSSATYFAPQTTAGMTSNPVAVTAEVDFPGKGTIHLLSNIKVLDIGAVGRLSMSINVDGTRTFTTGGLTKTHTEYGTGILTYDLSSAEIMDDGFGGRSINWDDAAFGGSTTQITDETQAYAVICNGGNEQTQTDFVKTTSTFSSTADGVQRTGLGIMIDADGNYTLAIGPSTSLTAGTVSTMQWTTGSCYPVKPDTSSGRSVVPFSQYFVAYIGKPGAITGKINPANPNRLVGTYHGTDNVTVFSSGTDVITMPFDYTITWDISLTK